LIESQQVEEGARLRAQEWVFEALSVQTQAEAIAAEVEELDGIVSDLTAKLAERQPVRSTLQEQLLDLARRRAQADAEVERYEVELQRIREDMTADGVLHPVPAPNASDAETERKLVDRLRQQWRAIASVDREELEAYEAVRERWEDLSMQREDLRQTEEQWREASVLLERMLQEQFGETLSAVNMAFQQQFQRLFGGGQAQLLVGDSDEGTGIDLMVQPPGKRTQSLTALSGGERSLTAAALLLALLSVHPTPFVVLDEVDAALDQANIARFLEALKDMAQHTQVLLITHQPASMEAAERLYGIVQQEQGVVQALSLRLDDAYELAAQPATNGPLEQPESRHLVLSH
jgi:chromosome segregation protein